MPTMTINGNSLYYELHGSGPPLMLIAGLASDSQSWQPVVAELADRFTVILPDNRGVGRSCQECDITVDLIAEDCMELARRLGFGKVSLAGHSMGGMAAMACAAGWPEMVDALILSATTARSPARNNRLIADLAAELERERDKAAWFRTILYWIFSPRFFDDPARVDGMIAALVDYPWPQSARAFRRQGEAIAAWDGTDLLGRIEARTFIMAGENDILIPPSAASTLAERIPGSTCVIIGDAAHSIHTEQPGPFTDAVRGFLSATGGPA